MQSIPILGQDGVFRNFLSEINPAFSASQLKNALRLCQGLCSSLPHESLSSMADSLLVPLDQSSLNRFLNESDWGCEVRQLDINRLHLMQKNRQTAFKKKDVFCLDDTLLTKTGKGMELTCNHFVHCSFSMKHGLSLVSLHYRDDTKNYNLFKEVYLRKSCLEARGRAHEFKTKLELAQDMLTTLLETEPSVLDLKSHFVFDSWFLSRNLTSLLESFNLKYVSRAKSNRVIKGLNMNLAEYANLILKDCDFVPHEFTEGNKRLILYCYTAILPISNLGDVKVVFVKLEKGKNVSFFLVSNHLRLTGKEIVELYKLGWGIEIDYKFSKQEIELSEWHLRKKKGILRYLTLCFITSTFLEYYRLMGCFGRHFGKDTLLNTKGKEVRAYRHLMFERFIIWVYEQCSRGRKIQDLLRQFREKNSRNHEVIQFTCQSTRLLLMSESA